MLESIHYSHSIYFILLLCSVSLHTKTHDNPEVAAYQKNMPHVQTLHSLSHSQSQSINELEDHLEKCKGINYCDSLLLFNC